MDKTVLGLVDTQVSALKASKSQAETTAVILELTKLLLDNAVLSSEALGSYDKLGVRELFAAYNAVGKKVCAFYDASKAVLDPAAQNGTIGKRMAEAGEQIATTTREFNELMDNEQGLLSKENALTALNLKYEDALTKVKELRRISAEVSDEVISALSKEAAALSEIIEKNTANKEAAENEVKSLRNLHGEVSGAVVSISEEARKINADIIGVIDNNRGQLENIYRSQGQDLSEVEAEIKHYIEQLEKIDTQVLESSNTLAFYEAWLGENSTIVQAMRKYGVTSLDKLTSAIDSAKANAEYELRAYDTVIKKVVQNEEAARTEILRKQNKVV